MTDYNCPECECGFTEKMGRKYQEKPDLMGYEDIENIFIKILLFIPYILSYGMHPRPYIIQCPNCDYKF